MNFARVHPVSFATFVRFTAMVLLFVVSDAAAADPCACPEPSARPTGFPTPLDDLLTARALFYATGLQMLGEQGMGKMYLYPHINTHRDARVQSKSIDGELVLYGSVQARHQPGALWFELNPCHPKNVVAFFVSGQVSSAQIPVARSGPVATAHEVWLAIVDRFQLHDATWPEQIARDLPLTEEGWNVLRLRLPGLEGTPFLSMRAAQLPDAAFTLHPPVLGVVLHPSFLRDAVTEQPVTVRLLPSRGLSFATGRGVSQVDRGPLPACTPELSLGSTGVTLDFESAWIEPQPTTNHPLLGLVRGQALFEPLRGSLSGLAVPEATIGLPVGRSTWRVVARPLFISGDRVAGRIVVPATQHSGGLQVRGLGSVPGVEQLRQDLQQLGMQVEARFEPSKGEAEEGYLYLDFLWVGPKS